MWDYWLSNQETWLNMTANSNSHGIEAYFTATEFSEFSEYEKLRLRNMKQNYEMMIKVGK